MRRSSIVSSPRSGWSSTSAGRGSNAACHHACSDGSRCCGDRRSAPRRRVASARASEEEADGVCDDIVTAVRAGVTDGVVVRTRVLSGWIAASRASMVSAGGVDVRTLRTTSDPSRPSVTASTDPATHVTHRRLGDGCAALDCRAWPGSDWSCAKASSRSRGRDTWSTIPRSAGSLLAIHSWPP